MSSNMRGVDIASHQGPDYVYPSWADFAVVKASGGHSYRNEHLARQVATARSAREHGLCVGFYHYMFEPTMPDKGGDPVREAENFIAAVSPICQPGDTLWLDVEEYPRTVGYNGYMGDWVDAFCAHVEAHFGCSVGIYCATWYLLPMGMQGDARLAKRPLWFASWQDEVPGPAYTRPWDRVTMWQYNADNVDKDLFFGGRQEWEAMGIPAPKPLEPGNEIIPHVLDDGRPAVTVVFAGQTDTILGVDVQDLGISVLSRTEEGRVLDQSVQGNKFNGWRYR